MAKIHEMTYSAVVDCTEEESDWLVGNWIMMYDLFRLDEVEIISNTYLYVKDECEEKLKLFVEAIGPSLRSGHIRTATKQYLKGETKNYPRWKYLWGSFLIGIYDDESELY